MRFVALFLISIILYGASTDAMESTDPSEQLRQAIVRSDFGAARQAFMRGTNVPAILKSMEIAVVEEFKQAFARGDVKAVELAIMRGAAMPAIVQSDEAIRGWYGSPLINVAARIGNGELVLLLCEHGADINSCEFEVFHYGKHIESTSVIMAFLMAELNGTESVEEQWKQRKYWLNRVLMRGAQLNIDAEMPIQLLRHPLKEKCLRWLFRHGYRLKPGNIPNTFIRQAVEDAYEDFPFLALVVLRSSGTAKMFNEMLYFFEQGDDSEVDAKEKAKTYKTLIILATAQRDRILGKILDSLIVNDIPEKILLKALVIAALIGKRGSFGSLYQKYIDRRLKQSNKEYIERALKKENENAKDRMLEQADRLELLVSVEEVRALSQALGYADAHGHENLIAFLNIKINELFIKLVMKRNPAYTIILDKSGDFLEQKTLQKAFDIAIKAGNCEIVRNITRYAHNTIMANEDEWHATIVTALKHVIVYGPAILITQLLLAVPSHVVIPVFEQLYVELASSNQATSKGWQTALMRVIQDASSQYSAENEPEPLSFDVSSQLARLIGFLPPQALPILFHILIGSWERCKRNSDF